MTVTLRCPTWWCTRCGHPLHGDRACGPCGDTSAARGNCAPAPRAHVTPTTTTALSRLTDAATRVDADRVWVKQADLLIILDQIATKDDPPPWDAPDPGTWAAATRSLAATIHAAAERARKEGGDRL